MARGANGRRARVDGDVTMRTREFLLAARLEASVLAAWVEAGWLIPHRDENADDFSETDLARAQLIRDLRDKMGVNEEGIPIILDLIDQVHGLRRILREVSTAVCTQPEEMRQQIVAEIRSVSVRTRTETDR